MDNENRDELNIQDTPEGKKRNCNLDKGPQKTTHSYWNKYSYTDCHCTWSEKQGCLAGITG